MRRADWKSPPGGTIGDLLEERGWSPEEFAARMGTSIEHVNELLVGVAPIQAELADTLSRVLGSTPAFWLKREANWRAP